MGLKRKRERERLLAVLVAALLVFTLSGCRQRTGGAGGDVSAAGNAYAGGRTDGSSPPGVLPASSAEGDTGETDASDDGEAGGRTRENPEATRKEFDENAPAEVVGGTERELHTEGGGNGAPVMDPAGADRVTRADADAEEEALRDVAADEAERTGVSEDAEAADSAMRYYTALLRDRTESLYECKRVNIYLETARDHVTIHKTSPEHGLITDAGAYDVSARLLAENLRVDDGWVMRKNPQVIVKLTDPGTLGKSAADTARAKALLGEMVSREGWSGIDAVKNRRVLLISEEMTGAPHLRLAAALIIAKCAYPDLFAGLDIDEATGQLAQEATGSVPAGRFYLWNGEE